MLNRVIVVLAVLFVLPVVSYSIPHDKLAVYYVYGSDVNVRRKPDLDSPVVATLPIASEIYILEKTKVTTTVDFYTDYWYKISYYNKKHLSNTDMSGAVLLQINPLELIWIMMVRMSCC